MSLENEIEGEESDPDYDPRLIDTAERPDAYVMRKELAGVIQSAIGQLPADQRTALILSDVEGMDYQEIADAMGTALGHGQIAPEPGSAPKCATCCWRTGNYCLRSTVTVTARKPTASDRR